MRIRKNAKLGSVPLEKLQTHVVCQLNQSPWDVIPFASDPTQFDEGEDSFTGNANGSPGDSVGAVESVASMMNADEKSPPKIADMVIDDNDDMDDKNKTTSCHHQCKNNEANKQSQSLCEGNNLSAIRSKKVTVAPATTARARRSRPLAAKKAPAASSNLYEFYYYSGFGPLWGKRRSYRNGGLSNKNEAKAKGGDNSTITEANGATIQSSSSPCSTSQIDNERFDYAEDVDEEDDDEEKEEDEDEDDDDYDDEVQEGNGESGKKRMRKPVKARSLKSLM